MNNTYKLILCSFMFLSSNVFGQNLNSISNKINLELKEIPMGEHRNLKIYLPINYWKTNVSYPVFYVLDGNRTDLELMILSTMDFYIIAGNIPKFIIVLIPQLDRGLELNPAITKNNNESSGKAAQFLEYITSVDKYIHQKYRAADFNMIFGHSLGASFATYALINKPNLFDAFILASPNYTFNNDYYLKQMSISINTNKGILSNKFIYLTIGDQWDTEKKFRNNSLSMDSLISTLCSKKYFFSDHKTFGHNTTPAIAIVEGLSKFFEFYWTDIPSLKKNILEDGYDPETAINKYFEKLSNYYNYKIIPESEFYKYFLIDRYIEKNKMQEALNLSKISLEYYPNDPLLLESYGDLIARIDKKKAKAYYQKAIENTVDSDQINSIRKKIQSL